MHFGRTAVTGVLVCALLSVPALAGDLGDPAPPLQIAEWVQGEAVDMAKGKGEKVYLLEFWATW